MKETNHSQLLRVLAGEGGDIYISPAAPCTRKLSSVKIGPEGATFEDAAIRGVDVCGERNYTSLPAGYIMVAGGDDFFSLIEISAGSAEGFLYREEIPITDPSITVEDGSAAGDLSATVAYSNAGTAYSANVYSRIVSGDGNVISEGNNILYFLYGAGSITLELQYPSTVGVGYKLQISFDNEVWYDSNLFEVSLGD